MRKINSVKSEKNVRSYKNYILLGICGLLAVVNIIMTIDVTTTGIEISNLEKKEAVLSDARRTLQDELVKTLSVSELQEKSAQLGFVKPLDTVYLSQTLPVA